MAIKIKKILTLFIRILPFSTSRSLCCKWIRNKPFTFYDRKTLVFSSVQQTFKYPLPYFIHVHHGNRIRHAVIEIALHIALGT